LVRRIRNDFAHRLIGLSFNTPEIANRLGEFNILQAIRDERGDPLPLPAEARKRFNFAVALLLMNAIESRIREMPKFQEATGAVVIPAYRDPDNATTTS
jgi:hypothetical protein